MKLGMNYRYNIKYWVFVNFPDSVLIGSILKHIEVLMGEEDIMHKTFSKKKNKHVRRICHVCHAHTDKVMVKFKSWTIRDIFRVNLDDSRLFVLFCNFLKVCL